MISHCTLCSLCQNQPPLLDNAKTCDVMWVGLSAKKVLDVNKSERHIRGGLATKEKIAELMQEI